MSWELSNCCLCLPLRVGLLIYGYFALVINYFTVLHELCQLNDFLDGSSAVDSNRFVVSSLIFAVLIIHFIFHIVLVAGLHKTSCGLLEVFYGYHLVTIENFDDHLSDNQYHLILVIAEVVVASLYLPLQLYKKYDILKDHIWIPVVTLVSIFICVLLQMYLITAVRSFRTRLDDDKEETYQPALHLNTLDDTGCTLQFYNKAKEYCDECNA